MAGVGDVERVREILRQAKHLAAEYYSLTDKPLGVTAEVAELEAADALDLELAIARTPGYDAIGREGARRGKRYQIKGRAVSIDDRYKGKVPSIDIDKEFDAVLLVLLDKSTYDALEIWEATRAFVVRRLTRPGSKSRVERRSMNITQFKSDQLSGTKSERVFVSTYAELWEARRKSPRASKKTVRK